MASTEAIVAAGSRVVTVDRDKNGLTALHHRHGDAVIPLALDLLDPQESSIPCTRTQEATWAVT
ncbi:hypothetical protein MHZ93_14770 [Roseomonas sp. ACRSG]|nr:hypothetical protein [Roseomonas sp. ACRSG]